ncbi:hypothetical protein [Clostridium brassicae]|uniref:Copper amine oxidase-like N-terminal domain-containing protein n=1 Tax=Clostridium brassicae TaxID=2999072 RepID=A0ABT4D619_9CLOT|nr:hypothetical protein [Clostridium brassicae]MCY6957744.1 hypothetical protein [Clostridium brassicae]
MMLRKLTKIAILSILNFLLSISVDVKLVIFTGNQTVEINKKRVIKFNQGILFNNLIKQGVKLTESKEKIVCRNYRSIFT